MKRYEVFVTAKPGIFDPAGETTRRALDSLGFEGVASLRIGKYIEIEADERLTRADVERACTELLSNPVIESFRVVEDGREGGGGSCCCASHDGEDGRA